MNSDIFIVDRSNRKLIFKSSLPRHDSSIEFTFAELKISKVQITDCFENTAMILYVSSTNVQGFMTFSGDSVLNARDKVISNVDLAKSDITSFRSVLASNNVIHTTFSGMTPTKVPIVVATFLKGPIVNINAVGITKDTTVNLQAQFPGKADLLGDKKSFLIKYLEDNQKNEIKSIATPEKRPNLKVGEVLQLEDWIQVTGATVDLTFTGEHSKFFTFKGRKSAAISGRPVAKALKLARIFRHENFMIEFDGDKTLTVTSVDPKAPTVLFTGALTLTKSNPRFHAMLLSPDKLLIEIYSSGEDSAFWIADRQEDGASKKIRFTKQGLKGNQGTFFTQARLVGSENKIWGILQTEQPSTAFYVGFINDLSKVDFDTYIVVKTDRVPDTFF